MSVVGQVLKWLGVALGILVVGIVGWVVVDGLLSDGSAENTNVTFAGTDGTELAGYLATPDEPGPHPAVLLIHEWWGLNEMMPVMAEALADEGYVVFAADAYRGDVTATVPRALWLRLTTPEDQVRSDLDDALAWLGTRDDVDPDRIASMGFCFGGGESLQLGLRQSEDLALTIVYYGALVTQPDLLAPLVDAQPVLGVFAEEDQQIFVDDVLEFEAALTSLDIDNQVTIYPGVGHAFIDEENFNQPGIAGDAWQEAVDFLAANLRDR